MNATSTSNAKARSGAVAASGSGGHHQHQRESILELAKMMETVVRVKCLGGRELQGVLRGYDDLVNLVLDDCVEYLRDPESRVTKDRTRSLGLVVIRGTQVSLVAPQDGVEEISNPFLAADHDDEGDF